MRWLLYLMFFYATYRFFRILSRRIAFTLFQQPRNSSRSGSQSGAQGNTGNTRSHTGSDARSGARYRAGGFQRGGAFRNQSRNGKPNFDTIEEAEFEDITENTSRSST